jgi:hypothetical protein
MIRALLLRCRVMLRAPVPGCNSRGLASSPVLLAKDATNAGAWLKRSSVSEAGLQRVRHRSVHTSPCLASAYRRVDRSHRYGTPAAPVVPKQAPSVPGNLEPAVPDVPAPAPATSGSQPPSTVQPKAPKPQPAPSPAQPAAAQPTAAAEVPSDDYGMPVRPGTGR